MAPVKVSLYDYYKGDSWTGMIVGPILINDAAPSNNLASVRMQFRDRKTNVLGYELVSGNTAVDTPTDGKGYITIDDVATWKITVSPQILVDLEAGTYDWDFECTDSTGWRITTYVGTLKVKQDVTYG